VTIHGSPMFPGQVSGIHAQVNTLSVRVGALEGHTAQVVADVKSIKTATDRFAFYEATVRTWLTRGILLVIGSVGTTYGVTRATVPEQQPVRTEVIKSKTTVEVEACTAMQPGPTRDACALKILTELMGPRDR
jgi:hypothetical protein